MSYYMSFKNILCGDLWISSGSSFQSVGELTETNLSPNILNLPTFVDNNKELDELRVLCGEYSSMRLDK